MRQKADKLEKGKWYADCPNVCNFLKYSHTKNGIEFFTKQIKVRGISYDHDSKGLFGFTSGVNERFIPTEKDIEKYNLNDEQ